MKNLQFLKAAAAGMACLGFVFPQANLLAAGPNQAVKATKSVKAPVVADVALSQGGLVTGSVVDTQGIGVDGAVVSIRQGNKEIARTVTDKKGSFSAKELKGGTYHIAAGNGNGLFRLWAEDTAPPAARDKALIVSGSQVVRAQMEDVDLVGITVVGAAITGLTLSAITLSEINDLEDKVDQIGVTP